MARVRTDHGTGQAERSRSSGRALLEKRGEQHCRGQRGQAQEGDAVHCGLVVVVKVEVLPWWSR